MAFFQELIENFEDLPSDFKRHLSLMRDLEDKENSRCPFNSFSLPFLPDLIEQRNDLQRELFTKKNAEENERASLYNQISEIFQKCLALCDERIELGKKLFAIQENFIRKLNYQIDKTEKDEHTQAQKPSMGYEELDFNIPGSKVTKSKIKIVDLIGDKKLKHNDSIQYSSGKGDYPMGFAKSGADYQVSGKRSRDAKSDYGMMAPGNMGSNKKRRYYYILFQVGLRERLLAISV